MFGHSASNPFLGGACIQILLKKCVFVQLFSPLTVVDVRSWAGGEGEVGWGLRGYPTLLRSERLPISYIYPFIFYFRKWTSTRLSKTNCRTELSCYVWWYQQSRVSKSGWPKNIMALNSPAITYRLWSPHAHSRARRTKRTNAHPTSWAHKFSQ